MGQIIDLIVLHCLATPEGRDVAQKDIHQMFFAPAPKGRGWRQYGYHDVIALDGSIMQLIPYDFDNVLQIAERANGARGFNGRALHLGYVGGMTADMKRPKDTRTPAQRATMEHWVKSTLEMFPQAKLCGHRDLPGVRKACPSFDVGPWALARGIDASRLARFERG